MGIRYKPEPDLFYKTVTERVDAYFNNNQRSRQANVLFYLKTILLISSYVLCYCAIFACSNASLAILAMICMGPLAILIGINVAHDAAHHAISSKKWINRSFLYLFDALGANSYMWRNRHVFSHHSFPNILNEDADLKQHPLVRIFPTDVLRKIHKYQFIYAPFLYLLYTINWLYFRDFQDFNAQKIGSLENQRHQTKEWIKLFLFKAIYITIIIVLPAWYSQLSLPAFILGFFCMNFAASITITLALIPSHVAEYSRFPLPDKNGLMPYSWSHHQVLTVIDFATKNPLLNLLFGGFNHHVTHHLFPSICHIHYPKLTPIIAQTCQEFGLDYRHESSFLNAYFAHYRLLKNNGTPLSLTDI
jgi:linoleoyl-CoA desaturase